MINRKDMEKKEYTKPEIRIHEIEPATILATSNIGYASKADYVGWDDQDVEAD